jgi:hypothetical protein
MFLVKGVIEGVVKSTAVCTRRRTDVTMCAARRPTEILSIDLFCGGPQKREKKKKTFARPYLLSRYGRAKVFFFF